MKKIFNIIQFQSITQKLASKIMLFDSEEKCFDGVCIVIANNDIWNL